MYYSYLTRTCIGRRKKNKRRRKRRKIDHPPDEEANSDQESTQQDGSTEPRLPKSCDLDATVACSTSSLGLLTSYHSNSSASCESNTDSGENDNVKLKRVKSQAQPDNEKYEVPSSIQGAIIASSIASGLYDLKSLLFLLLSALP